MLGDTPGLAKKIADEVLEQRLEERTECSCPDCGATLNIVTSKNKPSRTRLEFVKHN